MERTTVGMRQRRKVRPETTRPYEPTVTVVISCYNYAHFLPQAVRSCLSQPEVDLDIIIVDDASTDSSLAVAKALAADNSNISVLAHSHNKGMVETFNDGAKAATGEFLVRLDADDLLTPGSLGRATLAAQAYPSVGLVYGHPLHFSTAGLPSARTKASAWTIWPGLDWLAARCRSGKNVITSPEAVMRRSLVEELGWQAPLRHTPDMELWFRLSAFADVAYVHGADQAWHRDHQDSMSAKEVDETVDLRERWEAFEVLFGGPAAALPDAAGLQASARRTLTAEALATARHELDRGAGTSPLYLLCLELAQSLDPAVTDSGEWARLAQLSSSTAAPPWLQVQSLANRTLGRIRSELQWYRWHRTGVY
jgi:cellulose synthase/poly-beta-1,6-N-acetylglucosamine synthase-like glycosyltransferase